MINHPLLSTSLSLFLFSAGLCLADRATLDETKTQFALPLETAPTIDGVIDTAEWNRAAGANNNWRTRIVTVTDAEGNSVQEIRGGSIGDAGTVPADDADLSFSIFAGYDADYLYVAVRVRDSAVVSDSAAEGSANGTTWMDDSVEVFIDGDNSNYPVRDTLGSTPGVVGTGGQYVITANNAYREAEAGNPGYGEEADKAWYAKTTVTATGYDAEFRIALKSIGNPAVGENIGFTVGVNDDDDSGVGERQVIWVGKPHTECSYGNLVLGHRSYTAPKVTESPVVDGVINAAEYAGAERISLDGTSGNSELDGLADGFARGDLNYRAWAVHDQDAVYVAVDVVDDQIFTESAAPGSEDGSTWEDDSVEIFFDADHSKDLARGTKLYEGQYVLTANGAWRDNEANNPTFGEEGDWYAVSKPSFKGYQVEFKVKKTALLDPADGTVMGFNVAVNDDDGANRKSQLNWDGRPHSEFTYGQIVLGGGTDGSTLRISGVEQSGNNVKLTFIASNAGATYAVETASNIAAPQWGAVGGVSFGVGAGGSLTATFPKPTGKAQFYRVNAQ
ncbi:MAG: hypothetical protein JNN07_12385 [Verrucomicrobiales bacterium]|nr:hypothetical protein [Verrucomicrobiales bacterium]